MGYPISQNFEHLYFIYLILSHIPNFTVEVRGENPERQILGSKLPSTYGFQNPEKGCYIELNKNGILGSVDLCGYLSCEVHFLYFCGTISIVKFVNI